MTQIPDTSIECEQAVLGALLLDPESFERAPLLRPEWMYAPAHQEIAAVAISLHREQKPVDALTVLEALEQAGKVPTQVPRELPIGLARGLGSACNIAYYAEELRQLWVKREMKLIAQAVLRSQPDEKGDDLVARIANRISELEGREFHPVSRLGKSILARLEELEEQHKRGAAPAGLMPTGFGSLDALIGGLRVGHLTTIAARPGVGKTAFVSALTDHLAEQGVASCTFQLEDYADALADRAISRRARIPSHVLRDGRPMKTDHWDRIGTRVWPNIDWPIFVDENHGQTIHDITATMRRMAREHAVRVFILDNLSEVMIESARRGDQRLDRELGVVARAYRDAAHALGAVPVMLMHLNREVDKRSDGTPKLSDLKNSGDVEDASHLVAFLSREEGEDKVERIRVDISKHRNGPTGTVYLGWLQTFMAVEDQP